MNLLHGNIKKLYFTFLLSALGSTIISSIYSMVDMICVGRYAGPIGSAAIACVNPFWTIMFAPGVLLGMGGAVMMSNRRGSNNGDSADKYFTLATSLSVIIAVIVFAVIFFFPEPLLIFFGAEGEILKACLEYTKPVAFAAPTFTVCACISTFIRNDGEVILPTVATIAGGVVNIFGDIFFVFDFGLGLGVFGAGLATTIGQIISFLILCSYFLRKKCRLKFTRPDRILDRLSKIFTVGLSAFVVEVSFGVVTVVFNKIITKNFSPDHLAVYGTVSSVLFTLQCVLMTFGAALQPIVSANFGAKNEKRIRGVLNLALITSLATGVIFMIFTQAFPTQILKMCMDTNENVLIIGPPILRKYMSAILVSGISIVASHYLQSILKRTMSATVSILRASVLPAAFAILLTALFSVDAIWYSMAISEFLTAIISLIFIGKVNKRPI